MVEFECVHCGAWLKQGAVSCRECGSDAKTGWNDELDTGVDVPDHYDEDQYEDFLRREFPEALPPKRRVKNWLVFAILALVVSAFLVIVLRL